MIHLSLDDVSMFNLVNNYNRQAKQALIFYSHSYIPFIHIHLFFYIGFHIHLYEDLWFIKRPTSWILNRNKIYTWKNRYHVHL